MTSLYDNGLLAVKFLQVKFNNSLTENVLVWFSHVGSPTNGFLIYFPFLFGLNSGVGHQVLWIAVLSEWLNVVLKWIFNDDRPYWWAQEQHIDVTLKQWKETCESGPGFPSGHMMCTTAAFVLLSLSVKDYLRNQCYSNFIKVPIATVLWIALTAIMFLIGVSRVFIATHFPHQVTAGFMVGIIVALAVRALGRSYPELLRSRNAIVISFLLLGGGFLLYGIMSYQGRNPLLSVSKAFRWCQVREWVHLDTTIFYSLVRDSGALAGLGLTSTFSNFQHFLSSVPIYVRYFQAIIGTLSLLLYDSIQIPVSNVTLFYFMSYFKYAAIPFIVCIFIPFILNGSLILFQNKMKQN